MDSKLGSITMELYYAALFGYICNMKTVFPKNILKSINNSLNKTYPTHEAESMAYLIMEHIYKLSKIDVLVNDEIVDSHEKELLIIIEKLHHFEPIQYVFGYAEFYGHKYFVNNNVLIPRQETEELIQMIINENQTINLSVLDVGTGSGCIACSLAIGMNNAKVSALDLSVEALDTAKINAKNLACDVSFIQSDILKDEISLSQIDIVVSNPPYVLENEKKLMNQNVLDYEPELALFVPDQNPLLFYKVITIKAKTHLKKGGKLYFEVNEAFGNQVATMMKDIGYKSIKIHKDLSGKDRFVTGQTST